MLRNSKDLLTGTPILPIRRGKGSARIRGPLHIQYTDHGDDGVLRQLVEEVVAWPGIGLNPLPVASADLVSMRDQEQFIIDDHREIENCYCSLDLHAPNKAGTKRNPALFGRVGRPEANFPGRLSPPHVLYRDYLPAQVFDLPNNDGEKCGLRAIGVGFAEYAQQKEGRASWWPI